MPLLGMPTEKVFQGCAFAMQVRASPNRLDACSVHPELVESLLRMTEPGVGSRLVFTAVDPACFSYFFLPAPMEIHLDVY